MRGVYTSQQVSIGYDVCDISCQLRHAQSRQLVNAVKRESPRALPRVGVEERRVLCFPVHCREWDEAASLQTVPIGRLSLNARRVEPFVFSARLWGKAGGYGRDRKINPLLEGRARK